MAEKLLRRPEVEARTGLSRSTLYDWMKRGEFPQPVRLGTRLGTDGDKPGRDAAHALAERAHGLGWQVGILDPGNGADFNDILTRKAAA